MVGFNEEARGVGGVGVGVGDGYCKQQPFSLLHLLILPYSNPLQLHNVMDIRSEKLHKTGRRGESAREICHKPKP